MEIITSIWSSIVSILNESGLLQLFQGDGWKNAIMIAIACFLLYLAIGRQFEPDENGAPIVAAAYEGHCNYQDSAQRIYSDDKHTIQLSGKALLNGDICPALPAIADGEAVIFGEKRKIYRGTKARNPDGSVNYTQLDLM